MILQAKIFLDKYVSFLNTKGRKFFLQEDRYLEACEWEDHYRDISLDENGELFIECSCKTTECRKKCFSLLKDYFIQTKYKFTTQHEKILHVEIEKDSILYLKAPTGSGKTEFIVYLINNTDLRLTICFQTLKLLDEVYNRVDTSKIEYIAKWNSETNEGIELETIFKFRVIMTTCEMLRVVGETGKLHEINCIEIAKGRILIIDEADQELDREKTFPLNSISTDDRNIYKQKHVGKHNIKSMTIKNEISFINNYLEPGFSNKDMPKNRISTEEGELFKLDSSKQLIWNTSRTTFLTSENLLTPKDKHHQTFNDLVLNSYNSRIVEFFPLDQDTGELITDFKRYQELIETDSSADIGYPKLASFSKHFIAKDCSGLIEAVKMYDSVIMLSATITDENIDMLKFISQKSGKKLRLEEVVDKTLHKNKKVTILHTKKTFINKKTSVENVQLLLEMKMNIIYFCKKQLVAEDLQSAFRDLETCLYVKRNERIGIENKNSARESYLKFTSGWSAMNRGTEFKNVAAIIMNAKCYKPMYTMIRSTKSRTLRNIVEQMSNLSIQIFGRNRDKVDNRLNCLESLDYEDNDFILPFLELEYKLREVEEIEFIDIDQKQNKPIVTLYEECNRLGIWTDKEQIEISKEYEKLESKLIKNLGKNPESNFRQIESNCHFYRAENYTKNKQRLLAKYKEITRREK